MMKTSNFHTTVTVSALAGIAYFAIVFSVAFCFGAIRVSLLVPQVGALAAVLTELPLILVVSWKAVGWSVQKFDIPPIVINRTIMGVVAFLVLMGAELTLSVVASGKTASDFVSEIVSSTPQLIGLTGQVLYGLFPIIEGRVHRPRRETAKDQ
jgi:hypothetical protein